MKIKVKKLHSEAIVPEKKTKGAAAFDLYSVEEVKIKPGETILVKTGIALEIPEGYFGLLAPRSSLVLKRNLILANSVGIMDSDYRGEYMVAFRNIGKESSLIEKGERCAQLLILMHEVVSFELVNELSSTVRGAGGFGSTGK